MGTSKGYTPPTGYLWADSKRAVTNMVRNDFSPLSIGKAISSFSRALSNGLANAQTPASQMAAVGARAVNFIESVREFGFEETLKKSGLLHLQNLAPDELRLGLLNYFSGSEHSLYEDIAQQSLRELMRELLVDVATEEDYNSMMSTIKTEEFIREFIIKFIQNSFLTNFSEKILALFDKVSEYQEAERTIKSFIRNSLMSEYPMDKLSVIDWTGPEGRQIIEEKCNKALDILTVWSETLV